MTGFTDLQRLDLLFIDEIEQVNSKLLSAMEIVLQNVRDNRLPIGGVSTIMRGDPKQLKPPDGSLIAKNADYLPILLLSSLCGSNSRTFTFESTTAEQNRNY